MKGNILSAKSLGNWSDFKLKPEKGDPDDDDLDVVDERSEISCCDSELALADEDCDDEDEEDDDDDAWSDEGPLCGMVNGDVNGNGSAGTGNGITATGAISEADE